MSTSTEFITNASKTLLLLGAVICAVLTLALRAWSVEPTWGGQLCGLFRNSAVHYRSGCTDSDAKLRLAVIRVGVAR